MMDKDQQKKALELLTLAKDRLEMVGTAQYSEVARQIREFIAEVFAEVEGAQEPMVIQGNVGFEQQK